MISSLQIRAARAFLVWDRRDLSRKAVVPFGTIEQLETGAKPSGKAMLAALSAIQAAFETEGIEFTEDDGVLGVRNSGDRLRITGQLIAAETGTHIWANRFERRLADIFDLQDEITENIVGAVEPEILSMEMRRLSPRRADADWFRSVLMAIIGGDDGVPSLQAVPPRDAVRPADRAAC